jgi:molybdopterin converting factor small subunit
MWRPFDRKRASSVRIWVRGYLGLQAVLGDKPFVEFGADRVTLRDLLGQLGPPGAESHEAPGTDRRLVILVNGRHTSHLPDGLDTVLMDGDQVAVFPPVAGG